MRATALLMLLTAACRSADSPPQPRASTGETQSAAERVVQQQYDAYNDHDIDRFVAAHAPAVRFYRYPDSLVLDGRDAVRERFRRLFATAPQVHATVDARLTKGDIVVWKETATGLPGGKTNTAIFVWEVHDGLITRVLAIP